MLIGTSWSAAFLLVAVYLLNAFLYLLPGFALAAVLSRRRKLECVSLLIILTATTALLGYFGFWIFLLSKMAGKIYSFLVYTAAVLAVASQRKRAAWWKEIANCYGQPFALLLIGGLIYLSLLCLWGDPAAQGVALANTRFFSDSRPGDNLIPLIFADRVYAHTPLRPFCCGGWLSSDRPPLQTGIVLLLWPLRLLGSTALNYQVLASFLQSLWILGVWGLLRVSGLKAIYTQKVVVLLVFSGFCFYNSVYVWPKLFAAALLLLAFSAIVMCFRENSPLRLLPASLAGFSGGLTLLAHPGSLFSLPAIALAVLWRRRLFPPRALAVMALAPIALLLSWTAYQHWIDPPGNRLIKMHLAGVSSIDNRTITRTLMDEYGRMRSSEVAALKWSNLTTIIGPHPVQLFYFGEFEAGQSAVEPSRGLQREYIWNAIGLLNLGWFGLCVYLLRGGCSQLRPFAWLIAATLCDLVLWAFTLFGPSATYTTHSSYADVLLLAAALGAFLQLGLPRWLALVVLALQVTNLVFLWAARGHLPSLKNASLSWPFAILSAILSCALIATYLQTEVVPTSPAVGRTSTD